MVGSSWALSGPGPFFFSHFSLSSLLKYVLDDRRVSLPLPGTEAPAGNKTDAVLALKGLTVSWEIHRSSKYTDLIIADS